MYRIFNSGDMARHSRPRKLQPTELSIYTSAEADGVYIADLGALLSQVNRRTFRQGMQFAVAKIEFYASATATITIGRLPHHWPCVNSWTKAFHMWKGQQDDRLEESGLEQTIAAHRDFKIYVDGSHADGQYTELTAGTTATLYLTEAQGQVFSPTVQMDWDKSQVVIPNHNHVPGATEEYYCHMLGPDSFGAVPSFGMIQAYAESRNRPMQTDPNIVDVPSGGVYGQMFNVGDDTGDIISNAQDANAVLPYLNDIDSAVEFYPGGSITGNGLTIQDILSIQAGNRTVASSVVGPFLANCGFISFDISDIPEGEGVAFKITLVAGDYKGVMARPMQDVN